MLDFMFENANEEYLQIKIKIKLVHKELIMKEDE